MAEQRKLVGQNYSTPDLVAKVTGQAVYAADVALPGTLWGKVLRSPHAHARIVSIDLAAAAERLIAMSGQFEQRRLSRPAYQLEVLDAAFDGFMLLRASPGAGGEVAEVLCWLMRSSILCRCPWHLRNSRSS